MKPEERVSILNEQVRVEELVGVLVRIRRRRFGAAKVNPVLIPSDELHGRVRSLGAALSADYPDGVQLIAVLKGSTLFLADLVRTLTIPVEVDFLAVSSYAPETGRVRIIKDLESDVADHYGSRQ